MTLIIVFSTLSNCSLLRQYILNILGKPSFERLGLRVNSSFTADITSPPLVLQQLKKHKFIILILNL